MNKKSFIYSVSDLATAPLGSVIKYEIDNDSPFSDFEVRGNITGELEVMRIEKGLNVVVSDFHAEVLYPRCNKCLKSFEKEVEFEHTERQFFYNQPEEMIDIAETYLVDTKHQQIDISDMLRQEIILHFETFPVCSNSCQGICDQCGTDLNFKKCNCRKAEKALSNPFSALKELIK